MDGLFNVTECDKSSRYDDGNLLYHSFNPSVVESIVSRDKLIMFSVGAWYPITAETNVTNMSTFFAIISFTIYGRIS